MKKSYENLTHEELKQIDLKDEFNRKIYLYKIILIVNEHLYRLNDYITKLGDKLAAKDQIPFSDAIIYFDATERHHVYLLNVLGDMQKSSISYHKYRKFCTNNNFILSKLDEKESSYLDELTKERNFCNHIPESILVEDILNIRNDPKVYSNFKNIYNKFIIPDYLYIDKNEFIAKHEAIKHFYFAVKHMLECIISDYKLLFKTDNEIKTIINMYNLQTSVRTPYVDKAAKNVQKLTPSVPDEWIEYTDSNIYNLKNV